jgi:four helix bundle protein
MVAVYAISKRWTIEKLLAFSAAENDARRFPARIRLAHRLLSLRRMDKHDFQRRTKRFGLDVIALIRTLPTDVASAHVGRQLVRSGTGVGANYRHACRAKSNADFIAKMGTVEEEADESLYWLEVLVESRLVAQKAVAALLDEAEQLLRMVVASINTARGGSR